MPWSRAVARLRRQPRLRTGDSRKWSRTVQNPSHAKRAGTHISNLVALADIMFSRGAADLQDNVLDLQQSLDGLLPAGVDNVRPSLAGMAGRYTGRLAIECRQFGERAIEAHSRGSGQGRAERGESPASRATFNARPTISAMNWIRKRFSRRRRRLGCSAGGCRRRFPSYPARHGSDRRSIPDAARTTWLCVLWAVMPSIAARAVWLQYGALKTRKSRDQVDSSVVRNRAWLMLPSHSHPGSGPSWF